MLWLCTRFPLLPLAVFAAERSARPTAIAAGQRVVMANAAALEAGIEAGLLVSRARSLHQALQVIPQEREREQQALERLATWSYRFTPQVSLRQPDALLLEIGSCLRLHGSLETFWQRFSSGLAEQVSAPVFGLAHSPEAASLLSLHDPESPLACWQPDTQALDREKLLQRLRALPVDSLDCSARVRKQLHGMGLRQLGAILRLSRAQVGKRFGKEFCRYLDRIDGSETDPQPLFAPPEVFRQEVQIGHSLTSTEQMRFPMGRLLGYLEDYLRVRQLLCGRLHWTFISADKQSRELAVDLAQPGNDRETFASLSQLKLEQQRFPDGVETIRLHSDAFSPVADQSLLGASDLFPDPAQQQALQQEKLRRLADRLNARLGSGAAMQFALVENHVPELSWEERPFPISSGKARAEIAIETLPPRPHWLLPKPELLPLRDDKPWYNGPLTLVEGPERIDGNWWQARCARDYYIAATEDGGLYWIFQHLGNRRWFLHGVFA
ncbi:Y-family DNA polymerase [Biformimicrobium ophioploci]|uniref:DNA polymerase Y family protein n=1 Tax=Biformimicrobium ophioploci TaxID=3036711 RepID=A0ABQ6LYS2_9GAMM|nr:DNA polymerase Y family protein [Microbulbifer sp. NKW57]GMG87225.1 DNA polymerase Y family protein [Microbulbifer sp. NKW57]